MAIKETVLGTYTLVSGSFNNGGSSYFSGIVGRGYDTSTTTTSNYYSNSSGTIFTYDMAISNIPSSAVITNCYVKVNGHAESTSQNSEYMCAQIYAGNTALSSEYNFKSAGTSNSTQTITATTLPTVSQCSTLKLQCRLGYYGGAINGATLYVEYTTTTYSVTATSAVQGITVAPASQSVGEGDSTTITFEVSDISDYVVTDNDVDVTSSLVRHQTSTDPQSVTFIPSSFDSTNSVYNTTAGDNNNGIYSTNYINNGLTDHNSTTRAALYTIQGSGSQSYMYYNFDCSSIPANATINSVSCQVRAGTQGSTYYSSYVAQLTTGTTLKGRSTSITGSNTSPSTATVNGGTSWTRAELNNIKIKFTVTRGTQNTTTDSTFSFYGATLTVNYTPVVEASYYYTYTLNNVQATHIIVLDNASVFIPPEEDPELTYYPITISAINATTNPAIGTTRVEEGTNQTITITPSDPQLTLALDNGVDITSQLQGGVPTNTYTVTTQVSGASYGFNLNSSTGYYVSTNNGQAKSASVARLNMSFESSCVVTIQYINYAEASYDYGMFGKLDTAVATDGLTASSGSSKPSDSTSNYQLAMASNSASTQTITYNVPSGEHFIDIKYGKDDATNSNNDTLQWKVLSVESTGGGGDYTYTLTNIQQKHSLIFVFGNVSYYYVTSSGPNGMKLFPDGQSVVLEGNNYIIKVVPANTTDLVGLYDNNVDVTSSLSREEGLDKNNNVAVSYAYQLMNVQAAHTLVFTSAAPSSNDKFYIKQNGSWVEVSKIYLKSNNSWMEQSLDYLSSNNITYVHPGD